VLDGDTQLNDSSHIMAELIKKYQQAGRIPSNFRDGTDPEIRKWLDFADKRLAVLLFPNITRNMFESWEAFGYINGVPHFNPIQKIVLRTTGALAMRLANGKIKKKYNIEDERSALMDVVDEWVRDGLAGKNFHGGEAPDLADVSVFGCLKSIQSFTTFASLVGEADRSFLVWFNRMKQEIGESSCVSRT
jgi:microsomal prostaglandin-E synthase 2